MGIYCSKYAKFPIRGVLSAHILVYFTLPNKLLFIQHIKTGCKQWLLFITYYIPEIHQLCWWRYLFFLWTWPVFLPDISSVAGMVWWCLLFCGSSVAAEPPKAHIQGMLQLGYTSPDSGAFVLGNSVSKSSLLNKGLVFIFMWQFSFIWNRGTSCWLSTPSEVNKLISKCREKSAQEWVLWRGKAKIMSSNWKKTMTYQHVND